MPVLAQGATCARFTLMNRFASTLCSVLFATSALGAPFVDLGPMLGHVGTDTARVWVLGSEPAEASVVYSKGPDLSDRRLTAAVELTTKNHLMSILSIENLETAQRYFYAISLDGKIVTPQPYPSFTTAPQTGSPTRQRIVFTSCLGYTGGASAAAWAQMDAGSGADLILLLGDDHYADTTKRKGQSTAYFSHRATPAFRSITSRIPSYNIWDDHDFGPNDSDGTAAGKEESLATFKDFWPNPSYGEADNPGIYYRFTRGDVDFFMLDVRYHRSPDKMIDDGHKTMLGAKQLAWLKRELAASTGRVKIIASGSEWQPNSHADSWTSYPRERDEIFRFIEENQIRGVLLISGDRHFTGGYQIGGKLIEVTSGPLGSKNFPGKNLPDMFLNYGEGKLYSVFDIDTTMPEPKIVLEVHRAGDGVVEKVPLSWPAVLGEERLETLPVQAKPKKAPFQMPFENEGR